MHVLFKFYPDSVQLCVVSLRGTERRKRRSVPE